MAIDSHTHLKSDLINLKELILKIDKDDRLDAVINIGTNEDDSLLAVASTYESNKIYASVGVHPLEAEHYNDIVDIYYMYNYLKIVAIGEIGLDNLNHNIDIQRKVFIEQIKIANELCLPVIIHANNTLYEIKEVFEKIIKPEFGCVFHCFQPDFEMLDYIIKNGYYVSYAGKITLLNAKKSLECIKRTPNDLLLVETDSPYIPIHGISNPTSLNLFNIINKISEVKGMDEAEIDEITTENTKRLFYKIK